MQKDRGVYFLLSRLIRSCFFDTVHDLVQYWCYKGISARGDHSEKIFSQQNYEILLSSLSDTMLKNPESNVQARSIIMEIWQCSSFSEYKKAAIIDTSNGKIPIKNVLAELIVNWKREDIYKSDEEKEIEKKEIQDMMLFAKNSFPERFEFFKEKIIKNLRLCGREEMKDYVDYGLFAEELFSELEKTTLPSVGDGPWNNLRSQSKVSLPLDDGPQSKFEAPSVSGVSSRRK
ncbi:hypothetical protein [Wolbachia pipientis]|uniref:hypothetical protein n=1 Tax=Wolbachia pipientis TaxID=955 RepID=UPI002467CA84|nr:hypothetical protein [Wolbachia pipientis]